MSKRRMTFDQIVYSIVAIPLLFFASYIVSGMIGIFVFGFFARRFRLEALDKSLGLSELLGDGVAIRVGFALLLLIPSVIMTKRFFKAGWPESRNAD